MRLLLLILSLTYRLTRGEEDLSHTIRMWAKEIHKYMDQRVHPCDNFYLYACGKFADVMMRRGSSRLNRDILVEYGLDYDLEKALYDKVRQPSPQLETVANFVKKWHACTGYDMTKRRKKVMEMLIAERDELLTWYNSSNILLPLHSFVRSDSQIGVYSKWLEPGEICRRFVSERAPFVSEYIYTNTYLKPIGENISRVMKNVRTTSTSLFQAFWNDTLIHDLELRFAYPRDLLVYNYLVRLQADGEKAERKSNFDFLAGYHSPAPGPAWERDPLRHVPTINLASNTLCKIELIMANCE